MLIRCKPTGCANFPWERMELAFRFLKETDLNALVPGMAVHIDADEVFVQVQEYETRDAATLFYESHNLYFDVQHMVSGEEYLGCLPRELLVPKTEYDPAYDVTFYREPPYEARVLLREGDIAVVSPDEAHKPRCTARGPETVKKIVIKVKA